MSGIKKIILLFFIWRVLLFLPLLFASAHIPQQQNSIQYTIWAYTRPYFPVNNFLLYPWANFDGVHYLTIATDGNYFHGSDGRFFPFFPFVVRAITLILGKGVLFGPIVFFTTFFVANAAFLASLIMLYKLIRLHFEENTALQSICLLLVFPTSFFFGSLYSESTFLLLSVLVFYFLAKKRFLLATVFSMALLVTRVVGIAIIPILIWEIISYDKTIFTKKEFFKNKMKIVQNILLIALIPLGLLGFMWFNQHYWGDPFFFIHAQEHVVVGRSSSVVFFPQTLFRYAKILLTVPLSHFDWWISALELFSFVFTAIFLIVGYIKRLPVGYILFSLLCFLIPTQSGTFNGLPRYTMVLFPLFLAFALIPNKFIKIVYCIAGILALFFLLAFFSKGYFVA